MNFKIFWKKFLNFNYMMVNNNLIIVHKFNLLEINNSIKK